MNERLSEFYKWIHGKRVAVLGIGVSNTPLIRMLAENGAKVTGCDKRGGSDIGSIVDELLWLGVDFRLGDGYLEGLDHDIIFKTPGIRPDVPELLAAKAKGSVITSEMEVFFDVCPAPIIGITGSDGKSTTTTLICEMLRNGGYTCHLGGNLGTPLLPIIESIEPEHKVVVELSSFQLHTFTTSPEIAVITNVTPNHLDAHKDMEEYVEAKANIFRYQDENGMLVLNRDNPITHSFGDRAPGRVQWFSVNGPVENGAYYENETVYFCRDGQQTELLRRRDVLLPGNHNIENLMAAACAVRGIVEDGCIRETAAGFKGLQHRQELVREVNGVRYYNDSIASSPTRTRAFFKAFDQKLILIAGGYDKKIPFDDFGKDVVDHCRAVFLIGATASKIKTAIEAAPGYYPGIPPINRCDSMREAVEGAKAIAGPGDVVVLSPACASFDMYRNFAERGNSLKTIVNLL